MLLSASLYALVLAVVCAAWKNQNHSIEYSTVAGYFVQDDNTTNATTFDFRATNFGLINKTYNTDTDSYHDNEGTQWQRFAKEVLRLRHTAPKHVRYKVLFLGRHGEGFHNAAEAFYGTPAWNCYYSILNGNDTVTWADAKLTPTGINQALTNNKFWASEIETQKIPNPETFYTSPLTRCLATANLTFSGLNLKYPFIPTVKELLREGISGHTCDRRGSKSYIHAAFPTYKFEDGFTETDELWEALHGETAVDQTIRSKTVLDDIFTHDKSTYISITSHSGEIASILGVLKHRPFSLSTGAIIPVLVRAETLQQAQPGSSTEPFTGICTCTSPPAKSVTSSQCVTATATVPPVGSGSS